jgi:hypothetical protein
MMYFADVLECSNLALETLNCSQNDIGDEAAQCIAEMLEFNSSLRNLYIDSDEFTLAGIRLIREALENNISMKVLFPTAKDRGYEHFALIEALKTCRVRRGSTFRMLLCRLS